LSVARADDAGFLAAGFSAGAACAIVRVLASLFAVSRADAFFAAGVDFGIVATAAGAVTAGAGALVVRDVALSDDAAGLAVSTAGAGVDGVAVGGVLDGADGAAVAVDCDASGAGGALAIFGSSGGFTTSST
jgi:hypothetical protein